MVIGQNSTYKKIKTQKKFKQRKSNKKPFDYELKKEAVGQDREKVGNRSLVLELKML